MTVPGFWSQLWIICDGNTKYRQRNGAMLWHGTLLHERYEKIRSAQLTVLLLSIG
jgi:hypothetical protein